MKIFKYTRIGYNDNTKKAVVSNEVLTNSIKSHKFPSLDNPQVCNNRTELLMYIEDWNRQAVSMSKIKSGPPITYLYLETTSDYLHNVKQ